MPLGVASPADTARRTSCTSASPRRRSLDRRSRSPSTVWAPTAARARPPAPPDPPGRASAGTPPTRARRCAAVTATRTAWRHPAPAAAHRRGRTRPAVATAASGTRSARAPPPSRPTRRRRSARPRRRAAAQLVRLGDDHRSTAHRQRTGQHGILDRRVRPATANAWATATTCAAPPARVEGACRRTHCTGVSANAPDPVSPRLIASASTVTRAASPAVTMRSASAMTSSSSVVPARHSSDPSPSSASHAATIRSRRSVECWSLCHALIVQMSTDTD